MRTYVFPPRENNCPNPGCDSEQRLSPSRCRPAGRCGATPKTGIRRRAPYPAADPFEPFAIAAVELADEGIIVLGKVVEGTWPPT